jgi:hypothetical protein
VRKRRNADPSFYAHARSVGAALALQLWRKAAGCPVDFVAIVAATAVSLIIVVNAVFLQSGSRPAPFFVNPKPLQAAVTNPAKPAAPAVPARPALTTMVPQPVSVRRNDPIADLIGPSPRIAAVQRVLSDYGYGQLKPSGVLDIATSAAIERFERERKLPVTGRVSDRLVTDLAAMAGHPLE